MEDYLSYKIYYAQGGERRGPINLQEFANLRLPGDTLVWYKGMKDWERADTNELTAYLYENNVETLNGYLDDNSSYDGYEEPPYEKPSTYLGFAIFTTVACCVPFGIVSIVYASRVNSLWNEGRYDEAYHASEKAHSWANTSLWIGLIFGVINLLRYFL